MTNVLEPHNYAKSVFINCPFDSAYEPLFRGLIFAVRHMKLVPKSALGLSDAGQPRFDKILELIESCKYTVHDLSRTEAIRTMVCLDLMCRSSWASTWDASGMESLFTNTKRH